MPGDARVARVGGEQAGEQLEQCRLARAVGAEQHDEAALRQRQRERGQREALSVAFGQALDLQHGAQDRGWPWPQQSRVKPAARGPQHDVQQRLRQTDHRRTGDEQGHQVAREQIADENERARHHQVHDQPVRVIAKALGAARADGPR